MTQSNHKLVCIIGAGLVGSMLASYLANRGCYVHVYEKRPDIRQKFVSGNRTIAMSISKRGMKALQKISLTEFIKKETIPKHSRMVHHADSTLTTQRYGRDNHTINTIDRRELNEMLINKAEATGKVTFYFEHECEEMQLESGHVNFRIGSHDYCKKQYRWIIGADGVFSNVRSFLEMNNIVQTEHIDVHYGYRELLIPAGEKGEFRLEKDFVHVWPRKEHILVGLPSKKNEFTCNLFMPSDGPDSLAEIQTQDAVFALFEKKFPYVIPLMPSLITDYFTNAASKIQAIKTTPWNYKDRVLLIGDAAHAIVPFFAMGMNTCFEDCTYFDELMETYDNDISKTIEHFGALRKPHTDTIGDLSYKNFTEIAKSPDDNYHTKWHLERKIWDMYPKRWMPLYPMIAFSTIPLSVTVKRAEVQNKILMDIINSENKALQSDEAELKKYLEPILDEINPIPDDYL